MMGDRAMYTKADIQDWIVNALASHGGEAHLIQVAKHIWEHHEDDLRSSGDLFYTWQYDMRWSAQNLRDKGKLEKLSKSWRLL